MTTPRWFEISTDPNAPEVLALNQQQIDAARRPQVTSRIEHLVSIARNRTVLDVGVVEHRVESRASERWLHRHLVDAASACVGIDVLAPELEVLRAEGFDVELHDLSAAPMDQQFDVVVAGEVIEHVGAPEELLRNARRSLAPGGRVVVTTPNPYMLNRALHGLRSDFRDSADHVNLFGPSHLVELGRRAGLRLDEWRGVTLRVPRRLPGRAIALMRKLLADTLLSGEANCDTLIYEFVAE